MTPFQDFFRPGRVIVELNHKPVKNLEDLEDLEEIYDSVRPGATILARIVRSERGGTMMTALTMPGGNRS